MNISDEFNHEEKNEHIDSTKSRDSWTHEHERILLVLHKYANIQYKKYHETHLRYRKKLAYYRIPIIIITGIMGLLSISNSSYIPAQFVAYVSLLVGISNVVVTIISLIETFKRIEPIKTQALESYMTYKQINDELSLILRLPSCDRSDSGLNTINKYFKIFEKCQLSSPILQINSKDLFELDTLNDILNDEIDTEPDKKKWKDTLSDMGKNLIGKKKKKKHKGIELTSSEYNNKSAYNSNSSSFPTSRPGSSSTTSTLVDIEKASNDDYITLGIENTESYDINNIDDLKNIAEFTAKTSKPIKNLKSMISSNKNKITSETITNNIINSTIEEIVEDKSNDE